MSKRKPAQPPSPPDWVPLPDWIPEPKKPRRGKCAVCDQPADGLMFVCRYCGQKFCDYHRLPEAHHCPGQHRVTPVLGGSPSKPAGPRRKKTGVNTPPEDLETKYCPGCGAEIGNHQKICG
ncbi:MAG TPA: AN1-type zinc finger domain-containing protein [Candidatus Lokiarchaeia archaeon]|nr:AN1-type zinc finger domain-containing protein [Candidatus Lokiarchaeia archaeon]